MEACVRNCVIRGESAAPLPCAVTALLSNVQGDPDPLQLSEDRAWQTFTLEALKQDATISLVSVVSPLVPRWSTDVAAAEVDLKEVHT